MLDDLVKLKQDMEDFRHHSIALSGYYPGSGMAASDALSRVRAPLSPSIAAHAATLAERAVKLADGIASLKDRS